MLKSKRYNPKFDKLYYTLLFITFIPTLSITLIPVIIAPSTTAIALAVAINVFVAYFFISPIFGYAELRENSLYVKYGFFLKKEIPYKKIRGAEIKRAFLSDAIMSLKNSMEHVNIRYNKFDLTCVSVIENAAFYEELCRIISSSK